MPHHRLLAPRSLDRIGLRNAHGFWTAMTTGAGARAGVTLRPVTPEDRPMLFALRRDLALQALLLTVPDKLDDAAIHGWIDRRCREDGGLFRVIESGATGEAIGYAQIANVHRRNRTGYGGLVLTPKARGPGLGLATMKRLLEVGRDELGLSKLLAEVRADNFAALLLNLSAGYRLVGTLEKHFVDATGKSYDALLLERRLGEG